MQWGISFTISAVYESDLWVLPPPSSVRRLSSRNGDLLMIFYHFNYSPQSFREWQRVASIKKQIEQRVKSAIFNEYELLEIIGDSYTIKSLGEHFKAFVKFPKPFYPFGKDDYMRHLTFYAMRLYRQDLFYIEAVIAMALKFGEKFNISPKEAMQKAKSIMLLDSSEWKQNLPDEERHKVLSKSAHKAAETKRNNPKRGEAMQLRKDGKSMQEIANVLEVNKSTISRWLIS